MQTGKQVPLYFSVSICCLFVPDNNKYLLFSLLANQATTDEGRDKLLKVADDAVLQWAKGQKQIYDQEIQKADVKKNVLVE